MPPTGGYWSPAAALRHRVGLAGAQDNRALVDGMAELVRRGLMQCFHVERGGRDLVWQPAPWMPEMLVDPPVYGLHDIRAPGDLGGALPLVWYSETTMVRRMYFPRFDVEVDFLGCVHRGVPMGDPLDGQWPVDRWAELSRPVRRAAQAVADREGVTFAIVAKHARGRVGPGVLEARVLHAATRWRPRTLHRATGPLDQVHVIAPAAPARHWGPGRFDASAARAACAVQRPEEASAPAP